MQDILEAIYWYAWPPEIRWSVAVVAFGFLGGLVVMGWRVLTDWLLGKRID